jgi:hypothetical protein
VAETTVKRILCCGFRRTGKAMGQVYHCWWRICWQINVSPGTNITCFTFHIHLWPIYWLSLVLLNYVGFEVLTDFYRLGYKTVKSVKSQPTFRKNMSICMHVHGGLLLGLFPILKMELIYFSETSVDIQRTIWSFIPEDIATCRPISRQRVDKHVSIKMNSSKPRRRFFGYEMEGVGPHDVM